MSDEIKNQENLTNEDSNINETIEKTENIKTKDKKINVNKLLETKRGKFLLGGVLVIVIVFIVIMSQYPMSLNRAYEEYSKKCELLSTDEGLEWLEKEFDGKGLFGKKETDRKKQVLNKAIEEINNSFVRATGGTVEDFNSVEIEEVWFESGGKYSNYNDLNTRIVNKSNKNITYIKLNIYFMDSSDNIVGSDWTNDDSIIKPNATQTISKMVSKDVESASVEIADIRFE